MSRASLTQHMANLEKAEAALARAKELHEEEFKEALVELCNGFGLLIEATGSEGARLSIREFTGVLNLETLEREF